MVTLTGWGVDLSYTTAFLVTWNPLAKILIIPDMGTPRQGLKEFGGGACGPNRWQWKVTMGCHVGSSNDPIPRGHCYFSQPWVWISRKDLPVICIIVSKYNVHTLCPAEFDRHVMRLQIFRVHTQWSLIIISSHISRLVGCTFHNSTMQHFTSQLIFIIRCPTWWDAAAGTLSGFVMRFAMNDGSWMPLAWKALILWMLYVLCDSLGRG